MSSMIRRGLRSSVVLTLGGAAMLSLLLAPSAVAGAGDARSSSVKGSIKKLKQQFKELEATLAEVSLQQGPAGPQGQQGAAGPPGPATGPAGGDLQGNYPNPSVNTNAVADVLQQRITDSCPPGESIRQVNQNGTVGCETVSGGGSPTGAAGGDLAGSSYPNPEIAPDAVGDPEIAKGAVGSPEVAADSLGADDLAPDSVATSEVATNGVASVEITDGSVGTAEIATDGVGQAEIATSGVGSAEIIAGAVGSAEIGNAAVGSAEIEDGQVGTADQATIPGVRVGKGTAQSVSASSSATLAFTNESSADTFDTANMHDNAVNNTRLTAPVSGLYEVSGMIVWADDPDNDEVIQQFLIDGTLGIQGASTSDGFKGASSPFQSVSTVLKLSAGDFVQLRAGQDNTDDDALNVTDGRFVMTWLGPA